VIDANGTAHITRVVPLPTTLSPQARKHMSIQVFDAPGPPTTAAQRRPGINAWQKGAGERSKAVYPVSITDSTMGGVPVRIIDPLPSQKIGPVSGAGSTGNPLHYSVIAASAPETAGASAIVPIYKNRVLICLHGGGFDSDTGSYTEAIPIANLTRTKVVSVLYRLSPENPYPAALDDAIAVYKTLLKTYKPADMAIFGTSAGAILTGEDCRSPPRSACSQAQAVSSVSATLGCSLRSTASTATWTRPSRRSRASTPSARMWGTLTRTTQCLTPTAPTCTACRRRSFCQAAATFC
jgi:monoterpene epsilon-lactone hydrolase